MELIDIIVEKAKKEKQRVLLTESDGNANIDWDTCSLNDVETLLECGLAYVKKLKATTPYKEANKEYWRGYREGKQEVLDKYAELEKQGEQEEPQVYETEDGEVITYSESEGYKVIEPRFKVGEWITNGDYTWQIVDVKPLDYILQSQDGNVVDDTISYVDKEFHYFTIQDAKDGDVLAESDVILMFRGIGNTEWNDVIDYHCYYDCDWEDFIVQEKLEYYGNIEDNQLKPAAKEQRDLLFAKMHEAGYEWDAEDNVLKEIEQKTIDKAEPKFKVGDWVVYNRNDSSREILYVYDIRDGRYYFNDNIHFSWSVKECDEKCHLWSIEDAKDGDILVSYERQPFIFKGLLDICHPGMPTAYCGLSTIGRFHVSTSNSYWTDLYGVKPATKEQRDLLFQKMKEAGYTWNDEKKELNKIEDEPENYKQQVMSETADLITDYIRHKSAEWSEEDERMYNSALWHVKNSCGNGGKTSGEYEVYNWLKSLKQRIGG